jgi:hypothetical protein
MIHCITALRNFNVSASTIDPISLCPYTSQPPKGVKAAQSNFHIVYQWRQARLGYNNAASLDDDPERTLGIGSRGRTI